MDERKHLTFALLSLAAFAQQPAPVPATVCPPVPAVPRQSSSRGQHPRPPPHGVTLFSHFNYLFLFFFFFGNLGEDPDQPDGTLFLSVT